MQESRGSAASCFWCSASNCCWIPPCSVPGSCLGMKIVMNVVIPPGEYRLDVQTPWAVFLPRCHSLFLGRAVPGLASSLQEGLPFGQDRVGPWTPQPRAVPGSPTWPLEETQGQRDTVQTLAEWHQDGLCYSNSSFCLTYSCTY